MIIDDIIRDGCRGLGIEADGRSIDRLMKYSELLKEWNEKINLTAITDDTGIAVKHFLDSASVISTQKLGSRVIDVGTGAGFPGLVLKILKPDIRLTLLDSLNKRIGFLSEVTKSLSLEDTELVHMRAEDGGQNAAYREKFDTAVSRAVANLTLLSELCLPYVSVGGYFLALKGPMAEQELNDAKRAITILGGELEEVFEATIPFSELRHKIIIIKKVRHTPIKFPRKPAFITKNPIEQCYNLKKNAAK